MFTFLKKTIKKYRADNCVYSALKSDENVEVLQTKTSYEFMPRECTTIGILYYPGGRVEAESFANSARYFAEQGYFVSLEVMPFCISMLDVNRALKTKKRNKHIKKWILAGFSLGGVSAVYHIKKYPNEYDGLILYGCYASEKLDISDVDIKVLQLLGQNDGFSPPSLAENTKYYLPKDTQYFIIDGGNHVQFAEYNEAKAYGKDNAADITRDKQQKILREKTIDFIQSI